jgi:hypothetical protein
MAKSTPKDSQIILNMMKVQDAINKVIGESDDETIAKKSASVDLLTYYIVKLFALRKNFSGKTKKDAKMVAIFDDFKGACVLESMSFCYPTINDREIVSFARKLADEESRGDLIERYNICILDSEKYDGKE